MTLRHLLLPIIIIPFLVTNLTSCGGGSPFSLEGVAQKGSYLTGSSITFTQLSHKGKPTDNIITSTINDNFGHFSIIPTWYDWTKITVTGLFFNEDQGVNSTIELTLNSLLDLGDSSGELNVNLFTHLVAARIQHKINQGEKPTPSRQQALHELRKLLDLGNSPIEKLNLAHDTQRDNAILLAFSAGFMAANKKPEKYPMLLLNLSDDFADNGLLDGKAKGLFQRIATSAGQQGRLDHLSTQLKKQGYKKPPTQKTLGETPKWFNTKAKGNKAPTANAGLDQTIDKGKSVTLKGVGSDTDGHIVAYQWLNNKKIIGQSASLVLNQLTKGTHHFTLKVTDNQGKVASDSVTITVIAKAVVVVNKAPTANAGQDQTLIEGQVLRLKGSGTDPDGRIVAYRWLENKKIRGRSATLVLSKLSLGKHRFTLIVTDNKGKTASDSLTVTVKPKAVVIINKAPVANAGKDQTVNKGQRISLKGSGSDADGQIVAYQWLENKKVLAQSATLVLSQRSLGQHIFTLVVTDNQGKTASDSVTITVKAKVVVVANKAPVADAGQDKSITLGQSITLKGVGKDSDGQIVAYQWVDSNNTRLTQKASLQLSNLGLGKHRFTLRVTDNKGLTGDDSVLITVDTASLPQLKVNLTDERCITQTILGDTLHLKLKGILTGGKTGSGTVFITRYRSANCGGAEIARPSYLPSVTPATYKVTKLVVEQGQRVGVLTITTLGQSRSSAIKIDAQGKVTLKK